MLCVTYIGSDGPVGGGVNHAWHAVTPGGIADDRLFELQAFGRDECLAKVLVRRPTTCARRSYTSPLTSSNSRSGSSATSHERSYGGGRWLTRTMQPPAGLALPRRDEAVLTSRCSIWPASSSRAPPGQARWRLTAGPGKQRRGSRGPPPQRLHRRAAAASRAATGRHNCGVGGSSHLSGVAS
jgi:hypothetical protein